MPPTKLPLTLILAATPSLGIGYKGALPWPMLKKEMGYFARVTKRVAPRTSTNASATSPTQPAHNAVIMGRRTWESIPPKFRPLPGRVNVVVTRNAAAVQVPASEGKSAEGDVLVCGSLEGAIEKLEQERTEGRVAGVFVIGGASLYEQALELRQADRVLLTRIGKEYECDTFFKVDLEKEAGWRRMATERLGEFTGEEVGGVVEEKGVEFEFLGFERVE
ncbi:hypothetical protein BS50DRAFT_595594 [Corynespora cassiicola Philippines]|uniref:Dihydrofolate reductase n=1 Tax=Corynespora cassiicola Philippines TaxID=1448308 RepID=A0A2T2P903_CORCC|nr:hypothetical protein BS50DRAFT_595594 [Corynespora cassiicola Philippines]